MALNLNKDGDNNGSKPDDSGKKGFNLNKDNSPQEASSKGLNLSKSDAKPEESKLNLNKSSEEKPKSEASSSKGLNLNKSAEGDDKAKIVSDQSQATASNTAGQNQKESNKSSAENTKNTKSDAGKSQGVKDEKSKVASSTNSNASASESNKKGKLLIPVVLVALLGMGVFLYLNNNSSEKATNASPVEGPVENPSPDPAPTPDPNPSPAPDPTPGPESPRGPVDKKAGSNNPLEKTVATFSEGKFDLGNIGANQIQLIKEHLSSGSSARVILTGYASSEGDESFNNRLSRKRAEAMKKYLIKQGIDASRISTIAGGISNPIADNSTEEGRIKNRRVELELK